MPRFVKSPDVRLLFFILIIFCSNILYAPFEPAILDWFYRFYPKDNEKRANYIMIKHMSACVISSIVTLFSSFIADALGRTPYQNVLILTMRYLAFSLVLADVFVMSKVQPPTCVDSGISKLKDVLIVPFHNRKFIRCMLITFAYSYIKNLNVGLWEYHLLNHMHFSYTLINSKVLLYTIVLMLVFPVWQKVLRRYSWIKTLGIAMLLYSPTEILYFFMTKEIAFIFLPVSIIQHIVNVGVDLTYGNIMYLNLPEERSTEHISFSVLDCNIFSFLGLLTGTAISAVTGDSSFVLFELELYSVQFTNLLIGVLFLIQSMIMILKWRSFTPDIEIVEIEHYQKVNYMEK